MEANISKAGNIAKSFQETFATPEAIETGNTMTTQNPTDTGKSIKNAGEEDSKKMSVVPEYFTMKNPETW